MEKKLDLSKSVYDLVKEYPEVTEIMKSLGFSEITNKVMLNSVGKIMTIPKGAKMKGRLSSATTRFVSRGSKPRSRHSTEA